MSQSNWHSALTLIYKSANDYCHYCDSLIEIMKQESLSKIVSLPTSTIKIDERTFYQFQFLQVADIIMYSFKETIGNEKKYTEVKIYLNRNNIMHIDLYYDAYLTSKSDIYDKYCIFNKIVFQVSSRPGCRLHPTNQSKDFQNLSYPIYSKLIDTLFKS